MAAALDEMDGEEYDKEKTSSYDWEEDWEQYVSEGDIVTWLNFSKSDDPAEIMLDGFKKGDSKNNIEGPEGSNCAEEGAKNWKDNGNLKVVDLAGSSSTGEAEDSYDGASETAHESLMDTNVFRYYLHDNKDWDRNTSIRDRQRIEIKTEAKNPDINSYQGEILTNQWKFFLPEGYALPDEGSFFHIFQTKATQGDESSMPVFTLSVTKNHLYLHGSDCGHVNQVEYELASADIHDVLGRWIEAEITTYTAEKGYVYAKLQDISDPANKKLLMETGKKIDSWRRSEKLGEDGLYHEYDAPAVKNQMNRSKWGLYRKNDSPVPFDEMVMYLGDLRIIKHNAETYRFPDGFDPKEQTRDIYWAIESEPVKVLEGTDFSNIYLPAKVDVYVEGHDIESMEVERWEPGDYDQAVKGTYTVYGTLKETKGIENPKEVKAAVKIVVTDDISQKRVNWALGEAWGGTAKVKTLGGSNDNPSENLIDGSEETWWATNSGLIQQNEEDNGGWRYWAAVDLGEERTFDEIYYALGTIGSSKQFRLKNYTMFYSDNAKAWDELIGGTTGNPREKGVTPDPLKTAHGASWEKIPGVYKENTKESKQVTNNIKHTFQLEQALTARYILVYGEIETTDATAGAIQTKVLKVIGNKPYEDIPEIVEIKALEPFVVEPGTDFSSLALPENVIAVLDDQTEMQVQVKWQQGSYQKNVAGAYRLTGTVSFPEDRMRNPEYLKASAVVIVDASLMAETVNWAAADKVNELKVVSDSKAGGVENAGNLIDEDDDSTWDTHSSLMQLRIDGNNCKYWAALDLGAEQNVNKIMIKWGKTSNRLMDYAVYYAEDTEDAAAAFEALHSKPGTIAIDDITADPLNESTEWTKIDGIGSDSPVKKDTMVETTLQDSVNCRYLMLYANLDPAQSKGAIECAYFKAYGYPDIVKTEIAAVANPDPVAVAYGTPFGEIRLPETVKVTLSDASEEGNSTEEKTREIPVIWNYDREKYSITKTGSVWIEGTLVCPPDLDNPKNIKASVQINIHGEEIARKASVVFMDGTKEYCRYDDVIVGSKIAAPVNVPEKEGFVFEGWYCDPEGTEKWIFDRGKLTVNGLTLYAKWEKYVPEDPDTPEKPDTPDEPDTPEKPDTPAGSGSSGGSRKHRIDISYRNSYAMSGNLVAGTNGWSFFKNNGERAAKTWGWINGQYYYFDDAGNMTTGWQLIDSHWYYMNPVEGSLQGAMVNGVIFDPFYNAYFYADTNGAMVTGWCQIGENWYYFNPVNNNIHVQGALLSDTWIDGYYVGADGAWVPAK